MEIRPLHRWDLSPAEAIALQKKLAVRVDPRPSLKRCDLVAGADVSYNRFSTTFYAGVVVLRVADCAVVETQGVMRETPFPYIPGLLSFREAPALLAAFARVRSEPDAVMLDGQGFAHPRRIGLACHVGLWLDRPTIGCAKSVLVGRYGELGNEAGSTAPLVDRREVVGMAVRTKTGVQPMFVSIAHRINLESAVRLVLRTCRGYRMPEPTRQAHLHVNALRRAAGGRGE
jgi:deoxyribonuclease V